MEAPEDKLCIIIMSAVLQYIYMDILSIKQVLQTVTNVI